MSLLDKLFEYLTKEAEEADEKNEATIGPWRYVKETNTPKRKIIDNYLHFKLKLLEKKAFRTYKRKKKQF